MDSVNDTEISDGVLEFCGANFCNSRNLTNITGEGDIGSGVQRPDEDKIQLLTGILLGFALLASVVMAIFVDPLSK